MDRREANLDALAALDPELARRVAAMPPPGDVEVVPSRAGPPTARARAQEGTWVQVHSRVDPVEEARAYVAALPLDDTDAYVLTGLGLGYALRELSARVAPDRWIVVLETREALLRAGIETVDLASVLRRPRLWLFAGSDFSRFLDRVRTFLDSSNVQTLQIIRYPVSHRLDPTLYTALAQEFQRAVTRRKVELSTLIRYGEQLEHNAIQNLRDYLPAAGVEEFAGAFAGVPAYILGAGPSLNAALPRLREVQDQAIIVAVDKCTKLVLREGVRPHFTALLDMTHATGEFYRDLPAEGAPHLVFDPDAFGETVASYPGRKVSFETVVPWTKWATRFAPAPKGILDKGISVAHTAFLFLASTGARPIVLVGVDLAFPGAATHAEGVVMNWGGKVDPNDPQATMIPSVTGRPVRSNIAFATFVTAFEAMISRLGVEVWQASPEGALIRGAKTVPLEAALQAARAAEPVAAARIAGVLDRPREVSWSGFREALARVRARARTVADLVAEGEPLLRRLARKDPTNPLEGGDFGKMAKRMNALRGRILEDDEFLPLFQRVISSESFYVDEVNRRLRAAQTAREGKEVVKLEMERMDVFLKAYRKSAAFILRELDQLEARLP